MSKKWKEQLVKETKNILSNKKCECWGMPSSMCSDCLQLHINLTLLEALIKNNE